MSIQRRQRQRERQYREQERRASWLRPDCYAYRFFEWLGYDAPRWLRVAWFAGTCGVAIWAALVFTLGWKLGNRVAWWPFGW